MLIVCPSCATSYNIDQAALGPAGRAVRCTRCKTTWFAGGPPKAPEVAAFVNGVIAEAEAQSAETSSAQFMSASAPDNMPAAASGPPEPVAEVPAVMPNFVPVPSQNNAAGPAIITDAPSLVPAIEQAPLPQGAAAETDPENIETFVARRQRLKAKRQKTRRSSRWTAAILVLFAFNVALIGARNEVVRYMPQTASLFAAVGLPVNLRSLKFENVRISREGPDGSNMLIIEGMIVSIASKPTEVPRLRFAARNPSGQEVYTWTAIPTRSILGPGENLEFSSRLATPPADASDVMVRFLTPQDAVPGAK